MKLPPETGKTHFVPDGPDSDTAFATTPPWISTFLQLLCAIFKKPPLTFTVPSMIDGDAVEATSNPAVEDDAGVNGALIGQLLP